MRKRTSAAHPDHFKATHLTPDGATTTTTALTESASSADAFTRWCVEVTGSPPTPELDRKLRRRVEHLLFKTPDEIARQIDRLRVENEGDPYEFAELALASGIDVRDDPDWRTYRDIWERERAVELRTAPTTRPLAAVESALAHKSERRLARSERAAESATKGKRASRKSRYSWRRDRKRDENKTAEIVDYLRAGVPVQIARNHRELVWAQKSFALKDGKAQERGYDPSCHLVDLPHWEKADRSLRELAMAISLGERGGRDFTLNLGPGVTASLLRGDQPYPAKRMLRRVKDALSRELPEREGSMFDFAFFLETRGAKSLHLHGIVVVPAGVETPRLRAALRRAGGSDWKPKGRDATQIDVGELWEPGGWFRYAAKFRRLAEVDIGPNVFASTRNASQEAARWYQSARAQRGVLLPGKAMSLPATKLSAEPGAS